MIVFVTNFVSLLMINYLIFIAKRQQEWIGYTLLEMYILHMTNHG